ncbi:MAG TPA: dienelactone hydrolase family protein [Pyrinomonadaceae bacterium]|jgi:dienelactone hydrolase
MLEKARVGGWRDTCKRLAADGFLAFIPIREFPTDRKPPQVPSNKNELSQAVDHVKSLPEVDPSRVTLMGHSRGGLLTLMVGLERKDLKALIITAPASISPYFSQEVARVPLINAPVLLMVEVSDEMGSLSAVNILDEALRNQGKEVRTIRYDRGGGHFLFIRSGDLYWWDDVRAFLREKLL